jgi:two-component system response regulator AtoC
VAVPHAPDEKTRTAPARDDDDDEQRSLLVVWRGGTQTQTFELPVRGRVVIGRSEESDIRLAHPSVSRRHAALDFAGREIRVEDLGSSNGTFLAGRRLARHENAVLSRGAVVEVGLATMLVQSGGAPPAETVALNASKGAPESTMARIEQLVDAVARSRISVLLLGETGVGKEVTAERIHSQSPRANKPLVRLNCAAMPEALLESELFGHERGAFTGATHAKEGLLAAADGGTVLLDEVGELPPSTQAKLLRVIETREVTPVGSVKPRIVDIRFISATNRDLDALVANSIFRADLFFRLNGIAIAIPPLRNRRREIPTLARELVDRLCESDGGRARPTITDRAMEALVRAPWPGNVRQLRNALERAIVLCRGGAIDVSHLPPEVVSAGGLVDPHDRKDRSDLKTDLELLERARIVEALEGAAGNQSRAAKALGISRRKLVSRLDAYDLPRPRKKS